MFRIRAVSKFSSVQSPHTTSIALHLSGDVIVAPDWKKPTQQEKWLLSLSAVHSGDLNTHCLSTKRGIGGLTLSLQTQKLYQWLVIRLWHLLKCGFVRVKLKERLYVIRSAVVGQCCSLVLCECCPMVRYSRIMIMWAQLSCLEFVFLSEIQVTQAGVQVWTCLLVSLHANCVNRYWREVNWWTDDHLVK